MKKQKIVPTALFMLTMALLSASAIQQWKQVWTFKDLDGVYEPVAKADLTLENCRTGVYQKQMDLYLKENIGFREPLIRLNNQFLYDVFNVSTNKSIVPGKNNWLFFRQNVNSYYGTEMYRWFNTKEDATRAFDQETRLMWKLHGVLQEYGIDFFALMAPEKGFVYPEYLPKRHFDTTTVSAREYYCQKFDEYGVPYIEMTQWFINIKEADTVPFPLFPPTGVHWDFSAAYATDSMLRFMGDLQGIRLPKLKFGPLRESDEETLKGDRDCERIANLMRPLPNNGSILYDAEVNVVTDENTIRPNVLFVGTSFLERMYYYVPFDSLFDYSEFWYYNSTVRYGRKYENKAPVYERNLLQTLMESDYVVWQLPGEQMYRGSFGFVEAALLSLCCSDELVDARRWQLMQSQELDYNQAQELILKDPEHYFPEIAGDGIPTARNPKNPEAFAIRTIKKDPKWMVAMRCQSTLQQLPLDDILKAEAQNILNGSPLMRNQTEIISREAYIQSLASDMAEDMRKKADLMGLIEEKANTNGRSVEEQLKLDARWIIDNKIRNGEIVWEEIQ